MMKRAKMYIVLYIVLYVVFVWVAVLSIAQSEAQNIDIQPDNVHQEITYGILENFRIHGNQSF